MAETKEENSAERDQDSSPDKAVPSGMMKFRRVILYQPADDEDCSQADEQPLPPCVCGYPVLLAGQEQPAKENQNQSREEAVKGTAMSGFSHFLAPFPALLSPILISGPSTRGIRT